MQDIYDDMTTVYLSTSSLYNASYAWKVCPWSRAEARRPLNPATSSSFRRRLSEVTSKLLAQRQSTGTQYIICVNQLAFMLFNSHALSTQLHNFTWDELIASWSCHDLKFKTPQAGEFAVLKIYEAASTDSVTYSNSTLITQEPSNHPPCSCSNLSLLFVKCVTMNRRVLSEWQFHFHCVHYLSAIASNVAVCPITCEGVSIGDIFIHSNISAFWVKVRLLKNDVFLSCLFIITTSFFLLYFQEKVLDR